MELAGATTDVNRLLASCDEQKNACNPPEMPDLLEKFKAIQQQPDVQQSLLHAGDSRHDPRIRAVFAIAPAVARAFTAASLQKIAVPVEIVVGAIPLLRQPKTRSSLPRTFKARKSPSCPGASAITPFLTPAPRPEKKSCPDFSWITPASIARSCTCRLAKWPPTSLIRNWSRQKRSADHRSRRKVS